MLRGPLAGKLCATGLRAGDTNPEHTVMSLFLSTSIYLRCHNHLQMSHLGALDQQWDWAPEVRLSSELLWAHYFKKIQWGGCSCCWDAGMITAQMSLHFLNVIISHAIQQSEVEIDVLKAGHGAWCKVIFCYYPAGHQCLSLKSLNGTLRTVDGAWYEAFVSLVLKDCQMPT